jgi:uncharacterized Zn finger protein
MATNQDLTKTVEQCTHCGTQTPHRVTVEILTESTDNMNAAFSREPYRMSECTRCGNTTRKRMNNA